jgi:hypothetical protein
MRPELADHYEPEGFMLVTGYRRRRYLRVAREMHDEGGRPGLQADAAHGVVALAVHGPDVGQHHR